MKLARVAQWVRIRNEPSPTRPKPGQQVGSEAACYSRKGVYEAGCSESAGRVNEPRNVYGRGRKDRPSGNREGESRRLGKVRKAAVLGTLWQVCRTPPGSKSGACTHRGNLGTRESQLSPSHKSRKIRGTGEPKALALAGRFHRSASLKRDTNRGSRQGIGKRAKSEATRDGQLAVLAEHSTDGPGMDAQAGKVGNRGPRDPLQGRRSRA